RAAAERAARRVRRRSRVRPNGARRSRWLRYPRPPHRAPSRRPPTIRGHRAALGAATGACLYCALRLLPAGVAARSTDGRTPPTPRFRARPRVRCHAATRTAPSVGHRLIVEPRRVTTYESGAV